MAETMEVPREPVPRTEPAVESDSEERGEGAMKPTQSNQCSPPL